MVKKTIHPDYQFVKEVERFGPFQAEACYQCGKCTNGCPVTFAMDLFPDELIRMVLLGQRERVLGSKTIWVCSACETCTTRCPNEVMVAELMDCLKEMAIQEQIDCPQPQILTLHETFLRNVKTHGRIFEATFLPTYLLRSGQIVRKWREGTWQAEVKLGWELFSKGRISLLPRKNKGIKGIRQILTSSKQREKAS